MTDPSFEQFNPQEALERLQARLDKLDIARKELAGEDLAPETLERLAAPLPEQFKDLLDKAHETQNPNQLPPHSRFGFLKRIFLRLLRVYTVRQVDHNQATVALIQSLADHLQNTQTAVNRLVLEREGMARALTRYNDLIDELLREIEHSRGEIEKHRQETHEYRQEIQSHREEVQAHRETAQQHSDLAQQHSDDARQHREAAQDLHRSTEPLIIRLQETLAETGALFPHLPQALGDDHYVAFEKQFRGQEADIAKQQAQYTDLFRQTVDRAQGALDNRPIVDVGCGRGEFLEALAAAQLSTIGIDTNQAMIDICKTKNLDARVGDALEILKDFDDESLAGLVSLQVIEHLTIDQIAVLFGLAWQKLHPKGMLLIETVNPESLYAMRWFHMDWTHKRPILAPLAEFLLKQVGFAQTEIIPASPVEHWRLMSETGAEPADQNFHKLNNLIFAHQDYAIAAWKKERGNKGTENTEQGTTKEPTS